MQTWRQSEIYIFIFVTNYNVWSVYPQLAFEKKIQFWLNAQITVTSSERADTVDSCGTFGFYWRIKQLYIYLPFLALIFLR